MPQPTYQHQNTTTQIQQPKCHKQATTKTTLGSNNLRWPISREALDVILKSFNNLEQERLRKTISRNIAINEDSYKFSQSIMSPDVITESRNFYHFHSLNCKENYSNN